MAVPVTVGLLIWAARGVDGQEALTLLRGASVGWLLLAAALVPLEVWLAAERWRIGARAMGLTLSRGEAVREYALSTWLNQVLPGGVAGDALRVWRTRQGAPALATAAAVLDRAVGLAVLLVVALIGLFLWPSLHPDATPPVGAAPVALAVLVALGAGGVVGGRLRTRARPAMRPGPLLLQVLLSAAHTGALLLAFAWCGAALGLPAGQVALTAVPLLLLAMSIPLSVGGWGLREATAATLLPTLGWTPEAALLLSATYGLTVLLGALPGAAVLLLPTPPPPAPLPVTPPVPRARARRPQPAKEVVS